MSIKNKYSVIEAHNINNGDNLCWINAPLFATSAHELIVFQHLILDNFLLTLNDKKIIPQLYKYFINININNNKPWDETTYKEIYNLLNKNSSKYLEKDYFINKLDIPKYGNYGPGGVILQNFINIITKNYQVSNQELCYLKVEHRACNDKNEFNKLLKYTETYPESPHIKNFKGNLLAFVISNCTKIGPLMGDKPPENASPSVLANFNDNFIIGQNIGHWSSCVLIDKNKNLWRYFNALNNDTEDKIYDKIYDCDIKKGVYISCIYIDYSKLKKILDNLQKLDSFKNLVSYFESKKSKKIDINKLEKLSNNFRKENLINKLKDKNINLLKIEDIRKYIEELKEPILDGTIDIRGLLISYILKYLKK